MSDPRGDAELLQAWANGEQAAAEALVERHFATVYRFFHNKVGAAVHDLAQQTFLACVESKDRFEQRSEFRTFLLGIANNRLRRYFQDVQRGRARASKLEALSVTELLGSVPTSPTRRLARQADQRALLDALQRLPLGMQTVLELRYWEELTVPQIAEALGIAAGTVGSRLTRARGALKTELARKLPQNSVQRAMTTLETVVEPAVVKKDPA